MAEQQSPEQLAADHARIGLARELRRGMHLLVGRDPSTTELGEIAAALRSTFDRLEATPTREPGTVPWQGPHEVRVPRDGEAFPDSLNRPVSGSGNPFAIPMTMYRDGDAVVSTVTLEDAFEGAPGRSHGGLVSAIFDDLFGSLPMLHRKIAFTASLTVNYVSASPVREPVTFRGWINRVEGKKIFIEGEAHHGDELVTTASALFIDATAFIEQTFGAAG